MSTNEKNKLSKCASLANNTNSSFFQKTLNQLPSFFSKQVSLTNLNNSTSNIHSIVNQHEANKFKIATQHPTSTATSPTRKLTSKQRKDRFKSSKKGALSFNIYSKTSSKLSNLFAQSHEHNNSNPMLTKIVDLAERKLSSSDSEIQTIGTKSERLKRKVYHKSNIGDKSRLKQVTAHKNFPSPCVPFNERSIKTEFTDNLQTKTTTTTNCSTKSHTYNLESFFNDRSKISFLNKKNYKDHIKKRNVRRRSSNLNQSNGCLNQPKHVGSLNCSKTAKNDMDTDFRQKLLDLQRQQKEFAYAASSSLSPSILSPVHMRRRKAFVAMNYSSLNEELEFDYYFFKDVSLKECFLANTNANNAMKMNASSLVSSFFD